MTAPSERLGVTTRSFFRARIAVIMLIGLGALAACSIDGLDRGVTPPSGPTGVGVGDTGTGGGGGGGGGGGFRGTYTLVTANDSVLPVQFTYDSVSGVGGGGDTTVVFAASFDSSFISLNSTGTSNESDFLSFYEFRSSTIPGDSSYNRTVALSAFSNGTYTVTGTTLTLTQSDTAEGGSEVVTTYTLGTTSFTGVESFIVYNSAGIPVSGTVSLLYNLTGPPSSNVVRSHAPINAQQRQAIAGLMRARFGTLVHRAEASAFGARRP